MRLGIRLVPPDFAERLLRSSYERIFHEEMSGGARDFLRKVSWVTVGSALALVFSTIFQITAGNLLGADGYGDFTLIQSVAMFLHIPMVVGLAVAMVKYAAEDNDVERQSRIISTTYILALSLTIISVLLYFTFSSQFSWVLSRVIDDWEGDRSSDLLWLCVILATLLVAHLLAKGALRGLDRMRVFAVFEPVFAGITLFSFFIFWACDFLSFRSAVFSLCIASGVTAAIIIVLFVRRYLRPQFDKSWARTLSKYGLVTVVGGLSFILYTNTDRVLIGWYMLDDDVGTYRAYGQGSMQLMAIVSTTFMAVFFPEASKQRDKQVIFAKINKMLPYLLGAILPLTILSQFVFLNLYNIRGDEYPIDILLMSLFAVTCGLAVWYALILWTFNSEGVRGARLTLISATSMAVLNILLNIIMIPRFELYGAIGATITSFAVGILMLSSLKGRIVQPDEATE